jgi:quercetin dioxygenase-like cupin family protein
MSLAQSSILAPGEGETFAAGPFSIRTRVSGSQTGHQFEMYELALGEATVDYHVHNTMDETIYVLEGEIEFHVATERYLRPAGSVAFIPRGIHHGFRNRGPREAKVLLLFTPSRDQDQYFRELARLFVAPSLDTAALAAAQKQFDQVLIPDGA